MINFSEILWI